VQDFNIGVNGEGIERWRKMLPKIITVAQIVILVQ
jgi:uncharacterized membrane protein YjjB (DUF3815 family)